MNDLFYNSVAGLLHFNGSNTSTTMTDNGPTPKTWTANGNAQISTAQSVFGGASLLLDGSGDWVSTPNHADFAFAATDFTIEGRVRFANTASASEFVMSNHSSAIVNSSATLAIVRVASGKLACIGYNGASEVGRCDSTTTIAAATWYAFRWVRNGSNFYLFINGALETTATSSATLNTSADTFSIGRPGAGNSLYMTGNVDEVRITKAVARSIASYTLDTAAFPDAVEVSSGTLSLSLPVLTFAGYGGATSTLTLPSLTLAGYAGANLSASLPALTLDASSGGLLRKTLPMLAVLATAHDATGENALDGTLPSLTIEAQGGANASGTLPTLTISASGSVTEIGTLSKSLPSLTLSASGTTTGIGSMAKTLPMATMIGYGGAVLSVTLGGLTIEASGTTGTVGAGAATLPMFEIEADGTANGLGIAEMLLPALQAGPYGSARATLPMFTLTAIGTATVTATYEAYALNLNHSGQKDPVDEMTRYTNFPFLGVVRYQGSYFGFNATGLYLLEGTTDFDPAAPTVPTEIPWAFKTGISDFGTPNHKTLVSAYFGGRLGHRATVTQYVGEASQQEYRYASVRGPDAQNFRQVFGKGIKATYQAIGLEGEGELAIDTININVANLSRKI